MTFPGRHLQKKNTNPTSKNMFFKAYGGPLKGASSPSKTILPL
jgi:hypothetical protein